MTLSATRQPSAFIPVAMSIGALTAVLGSILVSLDTDELTRLLDLQLLADFLRYRLAGH